MIVELRPTWLVLGWPLVAVIGAAALAIVVVVTFPTAPSAVGYLMLAILLIAAGWLAVARSDGTRRASCSPTGGFSNAAESCRAQVWRSVSIGSTSFRTARLFWRGSSAPVRSCSRWAGRQVSCCSTTCPSPLRSRVSSPSRSTCSAAAGGRSPALNPEDSPASHRGGLTKPQLLCLRHLRHHPLVRLWRIDSCSWTICASAESSPNPSSRRRSSSSSASFSSARSGLRSARRSRPSRPGLATHRRGRRRDQARRVQ